MEDQLRLMLQLLGNQEMVQVAEEVLEAIEVVLVGSEVEEEDFKIIEEHQMCF